MTESKYIVGIDLGTTHCVLAYTEAQGPEEAEAEIRVLPLPQLVDAGEMKALPLLPSFLFMPSRT